MLEVSDSGFEDNFKPRMSKNNYPRAFRLFKASGLNLAIELSSLLDLAIKNDAGNKNGRWVNLVLKEFETHYIKHFIDVRISQRGQSPSPDDPTSQFLAALRAKLESK